MSTDENYTNEEKGIMKPNDNMLANSIKNGLLNELEMQQSKRPKKVTNTKEEDSFECFSEVKTDFDFDEYRNLLDAELDRIEQKEQQLEQHRMLIDGWWKSIEYYRDALFKAYKEIERREKKIEDLHLQIEKEKNKYEILSRSATNMLEIAKELQNRKKNLEMQLAEMKKISEGMAKKASEEAMLKALGTYAKASKRKSVDKRTFAKTAILELANVNGLVLPDDLAATIESLDDEQPDPKVVNVAGNYNDIHDNGTVNQK